MSNTQLNWAWNLYYRRRWRCLLDLYLRGKRGWYGGPAVARRTVGLRDTRRRRTLAVGRGNRGSGNSWAYRDQFAQPCCFLASAFTVPRLRLRSLVLRLGLRLILRLGLRLILRLGLILRLVMILGLGLILRLLVLLLRGGGVLRVVLRRTLLLGIQVQFIHTLYNTVYLVILIVFSV